MFQHANASRDELVELFEDFIGPQLSIVLADEDTTIYFTKTHIADLKEIVGSEAGESSA
jgi:hypothetical protein